MNDEADRLEGDPAALAVARRLADLDLAADSRVRASLRTRLLARAAGRAPGRGPAFLFRRPAGWAGALAAAAVVLLLLRPRTPAPPMLPAPAMMMDESPRPAAQNPSPARTAAAPRAKRLAARADADDGPFRRLSAASPFEVRRPVSGGSPFMTATARITRTPHGRAVVWELPHATLLLEDRPLRIDELFVRPPLQTSM